MKITKSQLKSLIKEEVSRFKKIHILENRKKEIQRELRILNEQWNPSDNYEGNYYLAIAPMDEPGEAVGHIISQEEVDDYEGNDWMVKGPYNEEEANDEYNKLTQSNRDFRYYDSLDDREGKSNLFIDPLDRFERDSLDTNW